MCGGGCWLAVWFHGITRRHGSLILPTPCYGCELYAGEILYLLLARIFQRVFVTRALQSYYYFIFKHYVKLFLFQYFHAYHTVCRLFWWMFCMNYVILFFSFDPRLLYLYCLRDGGKWNNAKAHWEFIKRKNICVWFLFRRHCTLADDIFGGLEFANLLVLNADIWVGLGYLVRFATFIYHQHVHLCKWSCSVTFITSNLLTRQIFTVLAYAFCTIMGKPRFHVCIIFSSVQRSMILEKSSVLNLHKSSAKVLMRSVGANPKILFFCPQKTSRLFHWRNEWSRFIFKRSYLMLFKFIQWVPLYHWAHYYGCAKIFKPLQLHCWNIHWNCVRCEARVL